MHTHFLFFYFFYFFYFSVFLFFIYFFRARLDLAHWGLGWTKPARTLLPSMRELLTDLHFEDRRWKLW